MDALKKKAAEANPAATRISTTLCMANLLLILPQG
jgi:hypothetical protein